MRATLGRMASAMAGLGFALACRAQAANSANADAAGVAPVTSIATWDQAVAQLRQGVWRLYAAKSVLGKDARGRTVANDLDEWVMTPDVLAQMQQLHDAAQKLNDPGSKSTGANPFDAANTLLKDQMGRFGIVAYYWSQQKAIRRQRDLWAYWVGLADPSQAARSKAYLSSLDAQLAQSLSPSIAIVTLVAQTQAVERAYNQERMGLAATLGSEHPIPGELTQVDVSPAICTKSSSASAGSDSGGDTPAKVSSLPSVDNFYPRSAYTNRIFGNVVVRFTVGPDNCLQHVEVQQTSGAPELDAAALELIQHGIYKSATHDGKPTVGSKSLRIKFALDDEVAPTTGAVTQSLAAQLGASAGLATSGASLTGSAADHLAHGASYLSRGDLPHAMAEYDAAAAMDPEAAAAWVGRGMVDVMQRNLESAQRNLDVAKRIDPKAGGLQTAQGLLAYQQEHYQDAIEQLTAALQSKPDDWFATQYRVNAYLHIGNIDGALADNAQLISWQEANFPLYVTQAMLYRIQGKRTLSIAQAETLEAKFSSDSKAQLYIIAIYMASGEHDRAMKVLDRLVSLDSSEEPRWERAWYRRIDDPTGARADAEAALKQKPGWAPPIKVLAELQLRAGDYAGSVATLSAGIDVTATDDTALLIDRAIAYIKNGQQDLAENDFDAARRLAKGADVLNNECWELATWNVALDKALTLCQSAATTSPKDRAILDSQGFVLMRLGRYDEAIRSYNAGLAAWPYEADSLFGRGIAEKRGGHDAAGDADIKAALQLDGEVGARFASYGIQP